MKQLTDADLALLEQFGGSNAPRLVAGSGASLADARITDAYGNPFGAAADGQLGQVVQAGGRRRRRATRRRSTKRSRSRSTGRRSRFSLSLRAQIRLKH